MTTEERKIEHNSRFAMGEISCSQYNFAGTDNSIF